MKDFFEHRITEAKFKVGDIVIPDKGPHKGKKHKVIALIKVAGTSTPKYNIKPVDIKAKDIKYKLGAVAAGENELTKEGVEFNEALKDKTVLIDKKPDKRDPDKIRDAWIVDPKVVLKTLQKSASPAAKKVLKKVYWDGQDLVDEKSGKNIITVLPKKTFGQIKKELEKWVAKNESVETKKALDEVAFTGPLPVTNDDPLVTEYQDGHITGHGNLSTMFNVLGIPNRKGRKNSEVVKAVKMFAETLIATGVGRKVKVPTKWLKGREAEFKRNGLGKVPKITFELSPHHAKKVVEQVVEAKGMDTKYAWSDIIAAMTRIGHGTKATMELKKALKTLTGEEKIQEAKIEEKVEAYTWDVINKALMMKPPALSAAAIMKIKSNINKIIKENENIQEAKTDIDHYKNLRKVMDVTNDLYGAILITIGDLKGVAKYDKQKSELIKLRKAIAASHSSHEKMIKTFKKD